MAVTELEKAYIAGLFDGEGCVTIVTGINNNGNRVYSPYLNITNTYKEVIDWISTKLIGNRGYRKPTEKHKAVYRFEARGIKRVVPIINILKPYLKIKMKRAEKILKYCELRNKSQQNLPYSTDELVMIDEIRGHKLK